MQTTAQDAHYWTEQFGTRASLLGGAATAGLGDNATVYYNPAAMAFVNNPNLSITVNAYKLRINKVSDALGKDLNLKETEFATFPSVIAGILEHKRNDRLKFGYSVNTKTVFTSNYDYLHQHEYEILDSMAGPENYVASYGFSHKIMEYWAGVAVSYQLTDAMSVGLAHFGVFRDVKYTNNIQMDALPMDPSSGDIASVNSAIDFKYWNVKGVFKPSIAFQWPKSKLGITFTTPSFNMIGKADVYRKFTIQNLDEHIATDITFVDRRSKQDAQHKFPGSIAIGVSKKIGGKSWIHFSNELFFASPYYLVFDPANPVNTYPNFIDDSLTYEVFAKQNFLAYGEQRHAFMNFGLGFERQFTPETNIMVGARTDFNYNARPHYTFQHLNPEGTKWHLFHFSAGFSRKTKKNQILTAGLEYTFAGGKTFHQYVNFTQPTSDNLLVGDRQVAARVSQHGFKVVLGIEIGKEDVSSL